MKSKKNIPVELRPVGDGTFVDASANFFGTLIFSNPVVASVKDALEQMEIGKEQRVIEDGDVRVYREITYAALPRTLNIRIQYEATANLTDPIKEKMKADAKDAFKMVAELAGLNDTAENVKSDAKKPDAGQHGGDGARPDRDNRPGGDRDRSGPGRPRQ